MKSFYSLLAYCILLVNSKAFGQPNPDTIIVMPEDSRLRGESITPYINKWKMYTEGKSGQIKKTGTWLDTVRIQNQEGKVVLERIQTAHYLSGVVRKHADKIYRNTLAPIETRVVNISGNKIDTVINVRYKDKIIYGYRYFNIDGAGNYPEIKVDFSLTLENQIFDWHLWGILIASQPLEEKICVRFLTHNSPGFNNSPFLWITASIIESETINTSLYGPLDCWKMNVTAEVSWTFWISDNKSVPPIAKMKIEQPKGSILWWK